MAPGHDYNLISSSKNFCDRFLAFLRPSTFKSKKNKDSVNLVLRKDNVIIFIKTFKKTKKSKYQQALKQNNCKAFGLNLNARKRHALYFEYQIILE